MNEIEKYIALFKEAKQNKQILHIPNMFSIVPTWNQFINNLNYKFNTKKTILLEDFKFHNDVLIYNKLDPVVFNLIHEDTNAFDIPQVLLNSNILNNIFQQKTFSAKALLNFVGNESLYYIHADDHDVVSWHCIGQMEWRVYPDLELDLNQPPPTKVNSDYVSYFLNPGDLLFSPKGIIHQVVTPEPRASIIYAFY